MPRYGWSLVLGSGVKSSLLKVALVGVSVGGFALGQQVGRVAFISRPLRESISGHIATVPQLAPTSTPGAVARPVPAIPIPARAPAAPAVPASAHPPAQSTSSPTSSPRHQPRKQKEKHSGHDDHGGKHGDGKHGNGGSDGGRGGHGKDGKHHQ